MMLELRFLGGIAAARAGTPVVLPPSKKTRALLAYLAVSDRAHRRERICEMFWDRPDDPRGSLRWSLSKLRGVVDEAGFARIVADREQIAFEAGDARIDVRDIKARCAALERMPLDELKAVAAAFRGDFLEGLDLTSCPEFHTWCVAEREQLRALQARVLSALLCQLEATPEDAIAYGRALVQLQPLDEDARLRLMRALLAAGHRMEADQYYESGRRAFAESGLAAPAALGKMWREARVQAAPPPREAGASDSAASVANIVQDIRFCVAPDGVRLAYATAGSGPPLVKTANWLNHLEFDWESPVWRHLLQALAHEFRLVRYDERGNGLSDWNVADISFEAFVRDLETVVDAAGLERFPLFGVSQGCAVSVAYAVRHPERVSRLVLYGGYARGWGQREPQAVAIHEALATLIRHGWGQEGGSFRQMFTARYLPEGTAEQLRWHVELQRISTSPENAFRIYETLSTIDIRPLLSAVRVPTLVLHCRGDAGVPFEEGRDLAAAIPGARFVPLEGHNHLFLEHEPAFPRFLAEVRSFLS
jgi:DNA-binding SARP family transcriptional activator/alpha-beta hydrolase superfamily lysophospholipase